MGAKLPPDEDQIAAIRELLLLGWTPDRVMRVLRISRATYFRRVRVLAKVAAGRNAPRPPRALAS